MPLVDIQPIEGGFDDDQKRKTVGAVTETVAGIEGEVLRGTPRARVHKRASATRGIGVACLRVATLLSAAAVSVGPAAADEAAGAASRTVGTHPSQGPVREIDGAEARLLTTPEAAYVEIRTRELKPHHVYTLWWVVINDPAACETSPCTSTDVLARTDAVRADVTGGGGAIAGPDGSAVFQSSLHRGSLEGSWFGNGFHDPESAEIHFVVNQHGPLLPSLAHSMLTSYRGGCRDDSLPAKFPDTAKADGIPGPNACALVQDAIFQQ